MRFWKQPITATARCLLLSSALAAISLGIPVNALTPYVYEPTAKELKDASIKVGYTAAQLIKLGQPKEAARVAALAVRLEPNNDYLWSILAEAQIRNKELEKASISLAKAKRINPKKASLWFAEASLALIQKKPNKAIQLLKEGINLEPKNPNAYFHLGNARVMQIELSLALKAFEKAFSLKPTFWEALNNKGLVLFELDQVQKAIESWRKVLEIKENAEPMLALAAALNMTNPDNSESLQLSKEALIKDPNYVTTEHQKEQLWGIKLRKATKTLLSSPKLQSAVERASANSDVKSGS